MTHSPNNPCKVTFKGRVDRVYFSSLDFSAGSLRTDTDQCVPFAGPFYARKHDVLCLEGRWRDHPKYGTQLKVTSVFIEQELSPSGLKDYLANHPDIVGIGPKKAGVLVEAFYEAFETVLFEEPQRMAEKVRLPVSVIESIQEVWQANRQTNLTFTTLSELGLTHHQKTVLIQRFGNQVVQLLRENPYRLCGQIRGYGFGRVDAIAEKLGVPKADPRRVTAGIAQGIKEAMVEGHTWVEWRTLVQKTIRLLKLESETCSDLIEKGIDFLLRRDRIRCERYCGLLLFADPTIHDMETGLYRLVQTAAQPNIHFPANTDVSALIQEHAPTLNPCQRKAVHCVLSHQMAMISGGAGSGKTFTLSAIIRMARAQGLQVMLAAPTGKAAKRMRQMSQEDASTIHRLLGYKGRHFERGPEHPLETDILIIDEVSMVDIRLAWHLFQAVDLNRTAVILVGDPNQLPPVGPGNLLRDLVDGQYLPLVVLDQIVRQAGALKANSMALLHGEVRPSSKWDARKRRVWYLKNQTEGARETQAFLRFTFEHILHDHLGFDLIEDVQCITPRHEGPLGTKALNHLLQCLIQKKCFGVTVQDSKVGRTRFYPKDRVLQTRNNYQLGIMNGDVGVIVGIADKGSLQVRFDVGEVAIEPHSQPYRDLQLAYAMTIHKSQGSEYPCVVTVIHKSHHIQHHRNLFYTAVTRATSTVVIVGDAWGIEKCALKRGDIYRNTFLSIADAFEHSPKTAPS